NRASIQNAQLGGELISEHVGRFPANHGVSFGRHLRSCRLARANRPDRFISDDQFGGFPGRDRVEGAYALAAQHVLSSASLALFQNFTYATNWREPGFQSAFQPQVHSVVGLAEILPAL